MEEDEYFDVNDDDDDDEDEDYEWVRDIREHQKAERSKKNWGISDRTLHLGVGVCFGQMIFFFGILTIWRSMQGISTEDVIQLKPRNYNRTSNTQGDTVSLSRFLAGRTLLAFGDSLTEGYGGQPYTERLAQQLFNSTVVNKGVSGDLTIDMMKRLPSVLAALKEKEVNSPIGAVVILGGTNDLGSQQKTVDTLANLIWMHRLARTFSENEKDYELLLANMIITIVVTIPQLKWPGINQTARLEINAGLREYVDACIFESKNVHQDAPILLLDLESVFDQEDPQNNVFWSDGVHFSSKGYSIIADMLLTKLTMTNVSVLQKQVNYYQKQPNENSENYRKEKNVNENIS